MHIEEADLPLLKTWLIKRLEDMYAVRRHCDAYILTLVSSCDADSDVLADYVLALISPDDPDDEIRSNCLENLEDFLRERQFHVRTALLGLHADLTKILPSSWKTC